MRAKLKLFLGAVLFCATPVNAQEITVTTLSKIQPDAVGLISAQDSGLPQDFWTDLTAHRVVQLISSQQNHQLKQVQSLLMRIMISELSAPSGAGHNAEVISARVDYLLKIGALDPADALLVKAGPNQVNLFKRWFDAKLMLSEPDTACAPLKETPSLSTDLATSIFCMAQNQDWFSADLTLSSGRELGQLDGAIGELLALFLDPEELETAPIPPVENASSPLEFTLREALALPRPARGISLAQSYLDLDETGGWLRQLRAAERLTRTGALPARFLHDIYHNGQPAASGGVWERVSAIRMLDKSLGENQAFDICTALTTAMAEMNKVRLIPYLAEMYATRLASAQIPMDCIEVQIDIILLHPNHAILLFDLLNALPETDLRRALVTREFAKVEPKTTIQNAVLRGITQTNLERYRTAESLLENLSRLKEISQSDPSVISDTLATLRAFDLNEEATRLGLELTILENQP